MSFSLVLTLRKISSQNQNRHQDDEFNLPDSKFINISCYYYHTYRRDVFFPILMQV